MPTVQRPLRIALISPKGPLYRHRGGIFGQGLRYKPLTLSTLASLIPDDVPHTLQCFDEGIADLPDDLDADLVGLTVITGNAMRAYELGDRLRARGITVVMGGPHPTLIPDDAQPHCDTVVVGYAEDTWPRLLRDHVAGCRQARYHQDPDLSLAGRPFPRREVLPRWRYATDDVFEATRSCVHACEFCVAPTAWGSRMYLKPVAEVVADIRRKGSRRALFVDLNLIGNRAYALELFHALTPLRIQWFGLATTLLAEDPELLSACSASGCRGLLMGLESVCEASLKGMRKGFNDPESFAAMVEKLHRHRISLQGCFVFGTDTDTPEVFEKTAAFAIRARIDLPRFAIMTPFPNTPLFKRLDAEGRILHRDWSKYDAQHVVFKPAQMSARQLEEGLVHAWRRCYSLTGMWQRLRHTAAPWTVALATNLGYRHYSRNLHRFYTCDMMSWDAPVAVGA